MLTDISYNNVKEEIVKLLTDRMELERYIINRSQDQSAGRIFSRNTKFPLEDMLAFMIMPRTESTAVELARFAELTDRETVCKQTFFMKRRQISDVIFDEINRRLVTDLYSGDVPIRKWNGLYLLAFDGTTLKLPDTPDINAIFPKGSNGKGEYTFPMAKAEVLKDVLNGTVIDIQVDTMSVSETSLAIRGIEGMPRDLVDRSLFIFDRGYIGAAWFTWLHLNDIQYIIRLPRGFSKEVDAFYASDQDNADIRLDMSRANWSVKGRKAFASLGLEPEECPPVMLHLVKCRLSTGETEVLAVRIKNGTPSCDEAYELYGDRWGVETTIDEFKNELQLEVFSGNSVLSVMQDIKAKVMAYNIGVGIALRATESLETPNPDGSGIEGSRRIKVNLNVGWHYLKESIVRILTFPPGESEMILTETLKNLKRNIEVYVLDRHLPHHSGSSPSGGKYVTFTNYKRAI